MKDQLNVAIFSVNYSSDNQCVLRVVGYLEVVMRRMYLYRLRLMPLLSFPHLLTRRESCPRAYCSQRWVVAQTWKKPLVCFWCAWQNLREGFIPAPGHFVCCGETWNNVLRLKKESGTRAQNRGSGKRGVEEERRKLLCRQRKLDKSFLLHISGIMHKTQVS